MSCGRRYFLGLADCLNMIYHCHRLLKAYAVCPLSHANDVSEIQSDFERFIMVSDDPILISRYRHWEGVGPIDSLAVHTGMISGVKILVVCDFPCVREADCGSVQPFPTAWLLCSRLSGQPTAVTHLPPVMLPYNTHSAREQS